jgi:hypothetical protein
MRFVELRSSFDMSCYGSPSIGSYVSGHMTSSLYSYLVEVVFLHLLYSYLVEVVFLHLI